MNRKIKKSYTRRRLNLNEDDNNNEVKEEKVTMPNGASTVFEISSLPNNQDNEKHYQLRDYHKKNNYCERSDNEIGDYSSDHSEYVPSPDQIKTYSPSISSSLGGDSLCLDSILNDAPVTRPPSTISNLSQEFKLIDNTNFVASPTVVYYADAFRSPNNEKFKKQSQHLKKISLIEISLKSAPRSNLARSDFSSIETEKTLIHDEYENLDLDKTLTNEIEIKNTIEKLEKKSIENEEINRKTEDFTNKYQIFVTIEPEENNSKTPDTDFPLKQVYSEITSEITHSVFVENSESSKPNNQELKEKEISKPIEKITFNENREENSLQQEVVEEIYIETETHMQKRLAKDNGDPLHLRNESTIYDRENENNTQFGIVEKVGSGIEVIRLEAGDDIYEETESINNNGDNINSGPDCTKERKNTRKRKRNESEWIDVKNKRLKDSGKAYEGCRSKKKYPQKTMKPSCTCKKKCNEKFTESQRTMIFKKYNSLGSHELQWQYIFRHVKSQGIKKLTVERKSTRTQTIKYYLRPEVGEEVEVCKIFFLNTLGITEQIVFTTLEKNKQDESFIDNRGKHNNRPKKMKPDTEESIMAHIKLFPTVESHYRRKDSKREYLSEQLNISKMYRLYKTWFFQQSQYDVTNMATKRKYEYIFNTRFNYSFFKPKKDQCSLCAKYKQAEFAEKVILEEEYRAHLARKDKVREMKNMEKETAMTNNDKTVSLAIYDLQKVLNIPQSEVSIFHYKRKYPIYNFTVFDAIRKKGYCFVWHAQIAKRGCTEIGSCLLQFMTSQAEMGIKKILFYSDGCRGQNKNRFIFALYLYAAKKLGLDIIHKFFVTGHSQNEGDSMHSCIERNLKNKVVYSPDQMYGIIMNAKVTGHKYDLKEMDQTEILDIKSLVIPKKWKKDKKGDYIRWSEVMEIKVSHSTPDRLFFKYDFDDGPYSELDTSGPTTLRCGRNRNGGRGRGRGHSSTNQRQALFQSGSLSDLKPAYDHLLTISKELHNDLRSLCSSSAIPRHYHAFYNSLRCQNDAIIVNNDADDSENYDSV